MSPTIYPEAVSAKLPRGWRAKLEALAERDERSLGSYLREVLRRHLESSERAERRRQAAK